MISNTDITIRLLASALLGSLIGFERERLLWPLNLVKVSQRDIRMTASRPKDAPGVQEVTIEKVR
jgi:hypothetical protein